MADPALEVENLAVTYRTRTSRLPALADINLTVEQGRTVGVVGESGCGKSTLASAVIGLLPPNGTVTGGSVRLAGRDLAHLPEREWRRVRGEGIGMIFQDPLTSLNPTFKVGTQLINAQKAHRRGRGSTSALRAAAIEMLDRVGIRDPGLRIDDYPHQFSGGMRQRIMIAMALLLKPSLLICDEATSALDVTLQAQILRLLSELSREEGTALLVISHDIGVIGQMSDDMLVLYAGRTVEQGPATGVLSDPQHPYTRKLLAAVPSRHHRVDRLATIPGRVPSLSDMPPGCTFANRCPAAQAVCRASEPPLIAVGNGMARCLTDVRDAYQEPANEPQRAPVATEAATGTGPLVTTTRLSVHFSARRTSFGRGRREPIKAVDGIDLSIARGEIVGLVGESGSGKTTLGKALLRLVPITSGEVWFGEVNLAALRDREWRQQRRQLQMIFQEPYGSLSPRMRVEQLITEPYVINRTPRGQRPYQTDQLLELVGLSSEQAGKYPHELSGGQARRVGIARALAMQPDFVVADEPTAGLDVSAAAAVLNLLKDLRSQLSLSQLIITHDLNVVGYVADRIAVMHDGQIVEMDDADRILDHPQHPYTQHLLDSVPEPAGAQHTTDPQPVDG